MSRISQMSQIVPQVSSRLSPRVSPLMSSSISRRVLLNGRCIWKIAVGLALSFGLGCQPKDENMARHTSASTARTEKAQVFGINYLSWVAAYMVDAQSIIQAGLESDNFSASASRLGDCGQITLDQVQGGKREIFLTHNECRPIEGDSAMISGEMGIQVYYGADSKTALRIQAETRGPLIVELGDLKTRKGRARYLETRNFGATPVDPADPNGPWQFRLTVEGNWSQVYSTDEFTAKEDGKQSVKLAGRFAFVKGMPTFLSIDEVWWSGAAPRSVTQKGRRGARAPNEYSQFVDFLLLRHEDKDTQQTTVLAFGGECGWPLGAMDVGSYSSSLGDDDRLTSRSEKRILFTESGIGVPARGSQSAWPSCDGAVSTHRSLSRVGLRTPYLDLFLK